MVYRINTASAYLDQSSQLYEHHELESVLRKKKQVRNRLTESLQGLRAMHQVHVDPGNYWKVWVRGFRLDSYGCSRLRRSAVPKDNGCAEEPVLRLCYNRTEGCSMARKLTD